MNRLLKIFTQLLSQMRMPKEEERIFLFLDLNDSTGLAEKLGHIKYSKLLTDCFNDLGASIKKYKAEVYQYVGDEVVLSWTANEVRLPLAGIGLYFDFENTIQNSACHYLKEYGIVPSFKASIHSGKVAVARIGTMRQYKVYHGDVLNACARMLELCSKLGSKVVISEKIASAVDVNDPFLIHWKGEIPLRGKSGYHHLFSVNPY